jgi:hypothetical protein
LIDLSHQKLKTLKFNRFCIRKIKNRAKSLLSRILEIKKGTPRLLNPIRKTQNAIPQALNLIRKITKGTPRRLNLILKIQNATPQLLGRIRKIQKWAPQLLNPILKNRKEIVKKSTRGWIGVGLISHQNLPN